MEKRHLLNWRLQGGALVIAALGCAYLSLVLRGDLDHWILCSFGAVAFSVLVMLVLWVAALGSLLQWLGKQGWRFGPTGWNAFLALCIIGLGLVVSFFPGMEVYCWELRSAKEWCEQCVPAIERHREVHGTYPARLSEVEGLPARPWLGTGSVNWIPEEDGFGFGVYFGALCGWSWDSRSQCWSTYD